MRSRWTECGALGSGVLGTTSRFHELWAGDAWRSETCSNTIVRRWNEHVQTQELSFVTDTHTLETLADETRAHMPATEARVVARVVHMAQDRPDLDVVASTMANTGGSSQDWR